ncbi:hypothetical protein F5H01DRAFT_381776 [Linnemannia elongata]|nr:hypothetical protein F5H01DRAFT_381776 [Linnemannia elongata]
MYIIHSVHLEATIITGTHAGAQVSVPRIPMCPSDLDMPFKFQRLQFPARPAFAMIINKSQGQTLDTVGIYLKKPVFAHGQLYVALSRVTNRNNVHVLIEGQEADTRYDCTTNVVYPEILPPFSTDVSRVISGSCHDTASTRLISTGLGLMVPERQHRSESKSESESESESGSLLVSSRNDSLGYDMWWQERQNEMWLRLDVDFILAGCEDAVVVTARGTVDGDADIDGYVEYERNLIDSALELLASSQAVPLQLQLADCRDGDGAPRIDSDK